MSYHLHHAWKKGANILGAQLATCGQCGTFSTTENGRTHYTRRVPEDLGEEGRIVDAEPPCVRIDPVPR